MLTVEGAANNPATNRKSFMGILRVRSSGEEALVLEVSEN
jgi:hypothetical protein